MKNSKIIMVVVGFILILGLVSCATTGKGKGNAKSAVIEKPKEIGIPDVDNFNTQAYEIAKQIQDVKIIITEVNSFLDDPAVYVSLKMKEYYDDVAGEVKTDLLNQLPVPLPTIIKGVIDMNQENLSDEQKAEKIILLYAEIVIKLSSDLKGTLDETKTCISSSNDVIESIKSSGMSPLKMGGPMKAVKTSISNLKSASADIPEILNQLKELVSKLS